MVVASIRFVCCWICLALVVVVIPTSRKVAAFTGRTTNSLRRRQSFHTTQILGRVLYSTKNEGKEEPVQPDILKPFPMAADPNFLNTGSVGEGDFVLCRTGDPTAEELSNENLLRILKIQCSDLEANTLVWKCLGYRFDETQQVWTAEKVFPKWAAKYPPPPPDLIGMQRIYSKEIDQPSLKANQALVRSIPVDSKQSLKTHLKPLGFTGYKYAELTPNKTRRAQCANWLLYYREELFGFTIDELKERRRRKQELEEKAAKERANDGKDEWKPPVKEVF